LDELKIQVRILKTDLKFIQQNFKDLPIQNHHFYELMQHQIIRIAALGITGFDSPVAFNSIDEDTLKVSFIVRKKGVWGSAVKQGKAPIKDVINFMNQPGLFKPDEYRN
jgi:cytochrome c peroxidase